MKNKLTSLVILSIIALTYPCFNIAASIKIQGLADQKSLKAYVNEMIVDKYKSTNIDAQALKYDTLKALKAKGYYAAKVDVQNDNKEYILAISPDEIYHVSQVEIRGYDHKTAIKLKTGDPLDAEKVLSTQKSILNAITAQNCYYELSMHHEIILDHGKHSAQVIYHFTSGPQAKFGKTTFSNLKNVHQSYLLSLVTYRENECWNLEKIDETKTALLKTGLFSYIKAEWPENPTPDGHADINFNMEEGPARSVRLGVSHQSDEGPGVQGKWSHKNLFGGAEEIYFDAKVSSYVESVKTDYLKPHFFGNNRDLSMGAIIERKNTDAFTEQNFNINSHVKTKHSEQISTSIGATAGLSTIKDETSKKPKKDIKTFGLISFPGVVTLDTRDNKLDPHRGIYSQTTLEPFGDIFGESSPFLRINFANSLYLDLNSSLLHNAVIAFRTNLGSIFGDPTAEIPASKRYFAGGGNSIRGFEYQHAGPLKDKKPLGGRSIFELSSELRVKVTHTLGFVTFVDTGSVYDDFIPNLVTKVCVGAGAGIRYYTDFGPLRLDVAVPMNYRENQNKSVQFYISLGQAF